MAKLSKEKLARAEMLSSNEDAIAISEMNKWFGSFHVLRDINLSVKRGERIVVAGPSGSGKSTLMNLLGCLDTPTNGEYFLAGQDVSKMLDNELAEIRNREMRSVPVGSPRSVFSLDAR